MPFENQSSIIQRKLSLASKADPNFKVFGAKSHQYKINPPISPQELVAFEKKYDISLPLEYRDFVTKVGNGGFSYEKSSAGPYYGIFPLGSGINLLTKSPQVHLKKQCLLKPNFSDDEWFKLIEKMENNDDISDEDYELEYSNIFSGVLPIGSQGCTSIHALILNGKYKGKVVNIDFELTKPRFAFESNFYEWYERWLDEVISGVLISDQPIWFGYSMGGNNIELINSFKKAATLDEKLECLKGLTTFKSVDSSTRDVLIELCKDENLETKIRHESLKLLTKFSYPEAREFLAHSISGDDSACLAACQAINWYSKEKANEWSDKLLARLPRIEDCETFRFVMTLLVDSQANFINEIRPFCEHENEDIRSWSFFSLGSLKIKQQALDLFIAGLDDHSPRVVHATLKALKNIKDRPLLKSFRKVIEKFKTDEHYILTILNHRVKEFGFNSLDDFKIHSCDDPSEKHPNSIID